MDLSPALSELNVALSKLAFAFSSRSGQTSHFAFQGDVYQGWRRKRSAAKELEFAQTHLRILKWPLWRAKTLGLDAALSLRNGH